MPYSEEQINILNNLPIEDMKKIILNNRQVVEDLVKCWDERLERYKLTPHIANGMDPSTSMGVQHGRTKALEECINDLRKITGL